VEWLGGSNLPGFSTTHFEVPIRQQASRYRVSVFAFDFPQSARIESPSRCRTPRRGHFCFHSRANRCVSAICAAVILNPR
jgi:hypothetical protein